MHLRAKKVAFLGLSMALSVVLVILSSVIESNTLFLLALASFFTGIALGEFGISAGAGYLAGSTFLSFLLAPNKLYVLTYLGISLYLVLMEVIWVKGCKCMDTAATHRIMQASKFIIFNCMYIPLLLFAPKIVTTKAITPVLFMALLVVGQVVIILYDYAYHYFMNRYWLKLRRLINN